MKINCLVFSIFLALSFSTAKAQTLKSNISETSSTDQKQNASIVEVEKEVANETIENNPMTASVDLNYNSLSNTNGNSSSGPGVGLLFNYALSDRFGVGMGFRQISIDQSGSASSINIRFTYAYRGFLSNSREKLQFNNEMVVESKSIESSCICLQILATQYYFNGSSNTVPFTGYGFGGYYKMPTKNKWSYIFGGLYESATNSETITSMSFNFGIEFRI